VDNIFALYRRKEQIPFLPKVNPVMGDLETLPQINPDARIDILIHLAGYFKTESQSLCEQINVQGTKNAIALCKNRNIPRILYFSTINVNLKAKGFYACSKLAAEDVIKTSGLEYMIIRPSLIYQARTGSMGRIIGYVEKLPLVPVFGSGRAKEQPIHIREMIALTISMIKDFKPGLTLYAAGKDALPFKELVKAIGRSRGRKARILPIPALPVYWMLKFVEKIGIRPGVSSEQVAHMREDLTADMSETLKLYPVELRPFEEHLSEITAEFAKE
jgi:nucleoside-diphosphate-sugar epimerase